MFCINNIVIEDDTAFNGHPTALIKGGNTIPFIDNASAGSIIGGMPAALQLTIKFPTIKLTKENSNGNSNYPASSVFGLRHIKDNATEWDASYADVVRANPTTGTFTSSGIFTLEDVKEDTTTGLFYHESGSASHPVALTGDDGLFTKGIRKFAAPVVGGFEGVNIFKTDPFRLILVEDGICLEFTENPKDIRGNEFQYTILKSGTDTLKLGYRVTGERLNHCGTFTYYLNNQGELFRTYDECSSIYPTSNITSFYEAEQGFDILCPELQ